MQFAQLGEVVGELDGRCDGAGGDGVLDDLVSVVAAGGGDQRAGQGASDHRVLLQGGSREQQQKKKKFFWQSNESSSKHLLTQSLRPRTLSTPYTTPT